MLTQVLGSPEHHIQRTLAVCSHRCSCRRRRPRRGSPSWSPPPAVTGTRSPLPDFRARKSPARTSQNLSAEMLPKGLRIKLHGCGMCQNAETIKGRSMKHSRTSDLESVAAVHGSSFTYAQVFGSTSSGSKSTLRRCNVCRPSMPWVLQTRARPRAPALSPPGHVAVSDQAGCSATQLGTVPAIAVLHRAQLLLRWPLHTSSAHL